MDAESMLQDVASLTQKVVGLADGSISWLGTRFAMFCDPVIATERTTFSTGLTTVQSDVVELVAAKDMQLVRSVVPDLTSLWQHWKNLLMEFQATQKPENASDEQMLLWAIEMYAMVAKDQKDASARCNSELMDEGRDAVRLPSQPNWTSPSKEVLCPGAQTHPRKKRSHRNQDTQGNRQARQQNNNPGQKANNTPKKVEKRWDLKRMLRDHQGPITSLMICNIPCSISSEKLSEAINMKGFKGQYDFLYLPIAQGAPPGSRSNLGYAFINFPDPANAAAFWASFKGYKFSNTMSQKTCQVRPAHVQSASGHNIRSTTPFLQPAPTTKVRLAQTQNAGGPMIRPAPTTQVQMLSV